MIDEFNADFRKRKDGMKLIDACITDLCSKLCRDSKKLIREHMCMYDIDPESTPSYDPDDCDTTNTKRFQC